VPEHAILVDTGPLVAFLVREDSHHAWAVEQLKRLPAPFHTCEPVLTETLHLVRGIHDGPARFFDLLDSGVIDTELDVLQERKSLARLMKKYSDLPMSLADACLVRMAEVFSKASVLTVDRHFLVYRKNGRQAIPAILPPRR
jgi:predicted nucleic acid-binding protein